MARYVLLYSNLKLVRSCSRLDLTRITRRRTQLSGEPDHRWEGNGVESTGQAAGLARKTQGLDHPGFRGLRKAPTGYDTIFVVHTPHVCVRVTKNEQENTQVKESVTSALTGYRLAPIVSLTAVGSSHRQLQTCRR